MDEPVRLSLFPRSFLKVEPFRLFSDTYADAREAFRTAVEVLQAAKGNVTLHSLPIVVPGDYTMDIAVVHGSLPGLVVHTSGVHGVEGFAGSAIQLAALQLLRQRSPYPTIIFVHAVNPYGMAHFRRVNENNVDLNRNGLRDFTTVSSEHYNKENYDLFDEFLFNPGKITWYMQVEFWFKGILALVRYGHAAIKAAMVGGQYHNPKGIFYGGNKLEPSLRLLEEFLRNFLSSNSRDSVTLVDVHTGLGALGVDTLLGLTSSSNFPGAELDKWFPGAQNPYSSQDGAAVSQGYAKVQGLMHDFMKPLFGTDQQILTVTQEFGTLPTLLVARALVLENAAYHHLSSDEHLEWAKRTTRAAFYPQSSYWRKQVLERGVLLLQQAMDRSVKLSEMSVTATS
jgi:hypothetical protein